MSVLRACQFREVKAVPVLLPAFPPESGPLPTHDRNSESLSTSQPANRRLPPEAALSPVIANLMLTDGQFATVKVNFVSCKDAPLCTTVAPPTDPLAAGPPAAG